jgi:hypothetical protein
MGRFRPKWPAQAAKTAKKAAYRLSLFPERTDSGLPPETYISDVRSRARRSPTTVSEDSRAPAGNSTTA